MIINFKELSVTQTRKIVLIIGLIGSFFRYLVFMGFSYKCTSRQNFSSN